MSRTRPPGTRKRTVELPPVESAPTKPLVLVLDDEWDICEAVRDVLNDAGFETVCLGDGERGLEYLLTAERLPAVILLDLMMPKMDGWAFARNIGVCAGLKDIPLLVVTAAGPHWGYPAGRVLRKPIECHELVAAVHDAIDGDPRLVSGCK
jgi:CheY-like chemotaxis protein